MQGRRIRGARNLRLWLITALPPCILSAVGSTNFLSSAPKAPFLNNAVIMRGIDDLAISQSAMLQASESSKYARATQEELVAQQALEFAQEPYQKLRPLVPQARSELLQVKKYNLLTRQHEDHVRLVEGHWRHLQDVAAGEARKAVLGWIEADAQETAAHGATINNKADRLASAVAAAVEPYHLALLRNQKFCAETYSKAKTATSSSQKLQGDAKTLALKAQELQASGNGLDAQESMGIATGMMSQAENLRQWGSKLYSQANAACSSAGGYEMAEQQAATNAAMTTIINAPMKLPEKS